MSNRFVFDPAILNSVAGGRSAIDIPFLDIKTLDEASAFALSYGFNVDDASQLKRLWHYHRRALVLMVEKLGVAEGDIPETLRDAKNLGDIRRLVLFASSRVPSEKDLQKWSCAILRCMHVFVHSENDLFSTFSEEIQSQVLTPFQNSIWHDGATHRTFLKSAADNLEPVELLSFQVKPFKTSTSTVIKLLAKPDALAMKVFDKLGVRFVTKSMFDSFQVIRFLVQENIISFAHIMPDQSSNNIYPVDLFLEVCRELSIMKGVVDERMVQDLFDLKLAQKGDQVKFLRKENNFSGSDYKFIKFITRKLIHIEIPGREKFSFFYPFEVQIMDQDAHNKILSGPSEHEAYKERQRMAARKRLLME